MGSPAADGAQPPAPAAALVERFAGDMRAAWAEFTRRRDLKLAVAVSGGADSTALLLLAAAAFPDRIEAATVDHGLRPESAGEAAAVAHLCARLGVRHAVLDVTVEQGNLQAAAREARYAALGRWMEQRGLHLLATAHHADDQAETLLMRLNRASGVAGLAATRARGQVPDTRLPLVRPLLGWRRAELADLVEAAGIEAVDDASNRDERFDRVRMRNALAGCDWLDIASLAQSASHLADADAAIDWAAGREWEECVRREGPAFIYRPQAPRAVALRVIARIVSELDGAAPRGSAVARVFESLLAGNPAPIGDLVARPQPAGWAFTPAPRRRELQEKS